MWYPPKNLGVSSFVMTGHTPMSVLVGTSLPMAQHTGINSITGDDINIIGEWSIDPPSNLPTISVCSKHNYFIHHPDILLTSTSLSNASHCSRRPLLANMVRSSSDVTPSLVWGNFLHEVMQTCLSVARWDDKFINKQISEVAQRGLGELLRINMGMEQAVAEVKARAKGLRAFADKYIASSPKVGVSHCFFHTRAKAHSPVTAGSRIDQHQGRSRREVASCHLTAVRHRRRHLVPNLRAQRED